MCWSRRAKRAKPRGCNLVRNPYLCLLIVGVLGSVAISGTLGMIFMPFVLGGDVRPPESLVAVTSGAMGALASFLTQVPRGSVAAPGGNEQSIR
jgi:hypothetical protein